MIKSAPAPAAQRTRLLLGIVNFVAGAAVMMIEISGNRLVAPVFGNSIYTWTALIGVVLVAFSVGNWLGGRAADKSRSPRALFPILLGAGILTGAIPLLAPLVAPWFVDAGLITGPLILSLLLFLAPGILLGMVSPMAVRWHSWADQDRSVGGSVGLLGMLGSLGSVTGTLATGFYLLPQLGVKTLLFGSALLLCLLALIPVSLAGQRGSDKIKPVLAALLCGFFWLLSGRAEASPIPGVDIVFTKDTFYHKIRVAQRQVAPGRTERFLLLDSTVEGGQTVESHELISEYQTYWRILKMDPSFQVKRALFLGAGAFGMPERVSVAWPDVSVDVAEIDPAVVQAGRDWFFLNDYPAVKARAEDARRFLLRESQPYDFIFADAYNGHAYIPPHLVTKEFFELVKSRLTPQGVLMMNVISAVKGPRGELGMAMLKTLRQVFPHVRLYAVGGGSGAEPENVIFMASQEPLERFDGEKYYLPGSEEARFLQSLVNERDLNVRNAPVFTDDHNHVESILARQLRMGHM